MAVPSSQTATDSRNYAQMWLRPAVPVHLVLTGPTVQIRANLVFPVVHCSRAWTSTPVARTSLAIIFQFCTKQTPVMFHTLLLTVSSSLRSSNLFEAATTSQIAKTKRKKATFATGGSNPWFATVTRMPWRTKFGYFKALTALLELKKPSLANEALLFLNWNVQRKLNPKHRVTGLSAWPEHKVQV